MRFVNITVLAILVIATVVLLAGCTSPASPTPTPTPTPDTNRAVKAGDSVSVDYIGKYTNGTIFDTSIEAEGKSAGLQRSEYAPLAFTVGSGQLIDGFDQGVVGMKVGETKTVTLPAEQCYGPKIVPIPMSEFTAQNITPEINDTIYYNGRLFTIDSITTDNQSVSLRSSHPLAGETLQFTITLRTIS